VTTQQRVTPPPERRRVELVEFSSDWERRARIAADAITQALGTTIVMVHHVGSTAVPGLRAKPIIDLLPEVTTLDQLDAGAHQLRDLGYTWRGEFGITGRRYCTLDDPQTGARHVQLHCFPVGHPEIRRMLRFRDYLRADPDEARAYAAEKERCRLLHPDDTMMYAEAKTAWIRACDERAKKGSSR
jgi:GrpB-like predicted nucleotidyltransferase (UPF0157 family)